MPATAGRVRMPHNNRVSTSGALQTSDIWSKTIGHDPYAAGHEQDEAAAAASTAEKSKGLLELARYQKNITSGESGTTKDDFARKMFLGLKRPKKGTNASGANDGSNKAAARNQFLESSSSEEEYVEIEEKAQSAGDHDDEKFDVSVLATASKKEEKKKKKSD
eukprot:CAMPEP_0195508418 /NCGR_PEP_ID=MMETSP0794_2-20130614/1629_1 /TAXON_ID=515487 /ORGANISM="Stephanopyxis turris, Strain CCMP 815" /LENGTH=162 /DNA_ID=CAMNT_0040635369 /DNA_START=79 /DNA_END=564 /DNA_ORIENTATION=-